MSFVGKVVLITGASSGIGAATAVHLSHLGASLTLHGRNVQNLQKVAEQCKDPKPYIVTGEMTNETDVKNLLESTIKKFGKLDVLVNNAGTLESGGIENTSLEQYDRYFSFLYYEHFKIFYYYKYFKMFTESILHDKTY